MTPLLLVVPLIAAAPVPKDFKQPAQRPTGSWRIASMEIDGRPASFTPTMTWQFADDSIVFDYNGTGRGRRTPAKIDPKSSPRTIDFDNGAYKLGVYEVAGDALVICMGADGARPSGFGGGPGVLKYVLKPVTDATPEVRR